MTKYEYKPSHQSREAAEDKIINTPEIEKSAGQ